MIIEKNFSRYIISSEESIAKALKKIIDFEEGLILALDHNGVLEGLFTKGDFLRWAIQQDSVDLNKPVSIILNKGYIYATTQNTPDEIRKLLTDKVFLVPILDPQRRPKGIARARKADDTIHIGKITIDTESPVFIIAEIGINHNGSLETAKRLVDESIKAGADCAKFQMRNMQALYVNAGNADDNSENLGSQYTLDILSRSALTDEEMFQAFDYCKEKGILPLCTPWDLESLRVLEEYGIEGYKVASADLTNHDLLTALAQTGKPIFCSTGMSTEQEIIEAKDIFQHYGAQYVLLQCNSTYPAPFKDINLNYLERLQTIGDCPVGYSGHERGYNIALAAVAKGARVIEKHITLDRRMEGNDHKVSLLPDEFQAMVNGIRQVEEALGTKERRVSQGEMMNRVTLAKSLVTKQAIKAGEIIREEMLDVKSPGRGLQPNRKQDLIGLKAIRDMKPGDVFYPSDLEGVKTEVVARDYQIKRPWGVPVRWYDYKKMAKRSNLDFLEFHLSFKDMDKDISEFFNKDDVFDMDFTVHSPDTFSGDHLLSPSSPNKEHRERSIQELQRVIDLTRELKPHFRKATRPLIIASLGGFTRDRLLTHDEKMERYDILAESLSKLDADGVEIIPQTLPPFPWYFGGQLYLNLFVDPVDTVEFCEKTGYRLCLDISHGKLACNHFHWSFSEYLELLGPHTAHLHIADSEGVDGEGLQIGEGDIDFKMLADSLDKYCPQASFIPEIWMGHENDGEGFWKAMERMEGLY
ncbi:MAG: N-acetylneuraminate synthase family protein [Anaerolineales bacterium]|nr:N-acetylneuraminate synthase family protein [Anaerolineales bacterium]